MGDANKTDDTKKKKRRRRGGGRKAAEPPAPPPKFYDTDRAKSSLPAVASALGGALAASIVQEMAVEKWDADPLSTGIVTTVGGGAGALGTDGNVKAFCAGVAASGATHSYAAWQDQRRAKKEQKRKEEEEKKRREEEEKRRHEEAAAVPDVRRAELAPTDDVNASNALAAARAEYEMAQLGALPAKAPSTPALPSAPRAADLGSNESGYDTLPVHLRPVASVPRTPRAADLSGGYGALPVHLRPVASG